MDERADLRVWPRKCIRPADLSAAVSARGAVCVLIAVGARNLALESPNQIRDLKTLGDPAEYEVLGPRYVDVGRAALLRRSVLRRDRKHVARLRLGVGHARKNNREGFSAQRLLAGWRFASSACRLHGLPFTRRTLALGATAFSSFGLFGSVVRPRQVRADRTECRSTWPYPAALLWCRRPSAGQRRQS